MQNYMHLNFRNQDYIPASSLPSYVKCLMLFKQHKLCSYNNIYFKKLGSCKKLWGILFWVLQSNMGLLYILLCKS